VRGGKKQTPTPLKMIRGNPGKRPLNKNEPEPAGPLGDPPASWTGEQCAIWHEVVNAAPAGVLTGSDRLLVELTARNVAQVRTVSEVTPAQSAELRRCLGEMGMTPSERGRLVVHKPDPDNPFLALLRKDDA
jgi:hypothetical protein